MLLVPKTKVINVKPNKMGSSQLLISQFLRIQNYVHYAPKTQNAKRHKSKIYIGIKSHLLVIFTNFSFNID